MILCYRAQYLALAPEWLKLVAQMVHPETNSLLVLYDDAQSINRRKARLGFSFAEVGIQARGRTTILRMNYRNTAHIMSVACEFARDLPSAKEAEHTLLRIPEYGDRVLRVPYTPSHIPPRVVTMHFGRRQRGKP